MEYESKFNDTVKRAEALEVEKKELQTKLDVHAGLTEQFNETNKKIEKDNKRMLQDLTAAKAENQRKEKRITTLEKKVDELQTTIAEMKKTSTPVVAAAPASAASDAVASASPASGDVNAAAAPASPSVDSGISLHQSYLQRNPPQTPAAPPTSPILRPAKRQKVENDVNSLMASMFDD